MHAFLINPFIRSIEIVDVGGDFASIGATLTTANRGYHAGVSRLRLDHNNDMWTDEMGYWERGLPIFRYRDYPHPIAGAALILGNIGSESADVSIVPSNLIGAIYWTELETTGRLTEPRKVSATAIYRGDPILQIKARAGAEARIAEIYRRAGEHAINAIPPLTSRFDVTDGFKVRTFDILRDVIYGGTAAPRA